jgi:hypothetical protein
MFYIKRKSPGVAPEIVAGSSHDEHSGIRGWMRRSRWLGISATALLVAILASPAVGAAHPGSSSTGPRSTASAIVDSSDRIWLFFTDYSYSNVWMRERDPYANWTSWIDLHGINAGKSIATVIDSQGRVVIFVRSTDNRIWQNRQSSAGSTSFVGWSALPAGITFASDPVVAANLDGRLEVVAATSSNTVYHSAQSSPTSGFGAWLSLGQAQMYPASGPDLAVGRSPAGRLVVTAGQRYRVQSTPGGSAWGSWQLLNAGVPVDHMSLKRTSDKLWAVGLDYNCNSDCLVLGSQFSDNSLAFLSPFRPGGVNGYAKKSPVALAAHGSILNVTVLGTDYNYWNQYDGNCGFCQTNWINIGHPDIPYPPVVADFPSLGHQMVIFTGTGTIWYALYWYFEGWGAWQQIYGVGAS